MTGILIRTAELKNSLLHSTRKGWASMTARESLTCCNLYRSLPYKSSKLLTTPHARTNSGSCCEPSILKTSAVCAAEAGAVCTLAPTKRHWTAIPSASARKMKSLLREPRFVTFTSALPQQHCESGELGARRRLMRNLHKFEATAKSTEIGKLWQHGRLTRPNFLSLFQAFVLNYEYS